MTNGSGSERFLTEPRNQHRIVPDEVRQDYFDGVRGLEKYVPGLKHNAHSALAQPTLELIARIEYGLAQQRWRGGIAVLRTMDNLVRETAPTGWTFFHLLKRLELHASIGWVFDNLHTEILGPLWIGQVRASDVRR
jgi:hypothetical protein